MKTSQHKYKNIKTVFFDVGNTLLFFNLKQVREILNESGYRIPLEKLRHAEGKSKETVDALVLTKSNILNDRHRAILYYKNMLSYLSGIHVKDMTRIAKQLRKKDVSDGLWNKEIKGTRSVLSALKQRNFRLAVISNSDGRVGKLLDDKKLTGYFEVVVDSAKLGVEKPDPRIFRHALQRMNAKPEHSLYIGDFYSIDVLGARRAGMKPLLIQPFPYYQHPPCATIKSLSELLTLLPHRSDN